MFRTQWFGMDHGCVHKTRREHEKKTLRHSEKYGYITPPDSKIWDISWPSSDRLNYTVYYASLTVADCGSY